MDIHEEHADEKQHLQLLPEIVRIVVNSKFAEGLLFFANEPVTFSVALLDFMEPVFTLPYWRTIEGFINAGKINCDIMPNLSDTEEQRIFKSFEKIRERVIALDLSWQNEKYSSSIREYFRARGLPV